LQVIVKRKDFMKRVKPMLEKKDVRSLFKYKLPKDEEEYVIIVNSIYLRNGWEKLKLYVAEM